PHAAESVAGLQLGGPSSVGVATRARALCPGPNSAYRASSRRSRPSVHAQWLAVHGVRDQTSDHETSPPGRAPTIAEPAWRASSAASAAARKATRASRRNAASKGPPPVLAAPTR